MCLKGFIFCILLYGIIMCVFNIKIIIFFIKIGCGYLSLYFKVYRFRDVSLVLYLGIIGLLFKQFLLNRIIFRIFVFYVVEVVLWDQKVRIKSYRIDQNGSKNVYWGGNVQLVKMNMGIELKQCKLKWESYMEI